MTVEAVVAALLPSLIVSLFMAAFNNRQQRREKAVDDRARARKRESLLALNMQMATAKLAYANAMAIKRGEPNGEIEDGIEAYEKAAEAFDTFLKEHVVDHLT